MRLLNTRRHRDGRRHRPRVELLEHRRMLAGEPLIISELMAANRTALRDRFREYSDWIEIYNPSAEPVNLEGWALTDDANQLDRWLFPDLNIEGQATLVVHASGRDRTNPTRQLHTNFSLTNDGEYLALIRPDGTIAHQFEDGFPQLRADVSYGVAFSVDGPMLDQLVYFEQSSPGELNALGVADRAQPVVFGVPRGFYDEPFELTLATNTLNGQIRYTTNGSPPTLDASRLFEQPIVVDTTTMIRAAVFGDGLLSSDVETQTYIFLDAVLQQTGEGMPEQWGFYDDMGPPPPARAPANYEVDPDVVNHELYASTIKDDLRAVPTLSIVMKHEDLWDLDRGIYMNPCFPKDGCQFEYPTSLEWIDTDGSTIIQEDAGIRIHGGWARRFSRNRKLSFRVVFQDEYGPETLNYPLFGEEGQQQFNSLVLRGGFNDQWRDNDSGNTYTQDQWTRQAQRDVGGYAVRNNYVHLYLNGLYWGMYSPTERPDALWAASNRGGREDEYDVINTGGSVVDGTGIAFTELMRMLVPSRFDYAEVSKVVDMVDFADYLIVNQYVGNWDWPHNNWYASRRRVDGGQWYFHSWDAEAAYQRGITEDRVTNVDDRDGPSRLYLRVREVPEFQEMFADRVQKHLFGDGALSPDAGIERLNDLAAQIDRAIVGESARWGDGFTDQRRTPTTRENWVRRIANINRTFFPNRGERMLRQYRGVRLYPESDAPLFDPIPGAIDRDTDVTITAPEGDIFYTVNGTNPRTADGNVAADAVRLNSRDLVGPGQPGKLLAAQADDLQQPWQMLAFDDQTWTDVNTSVGYDLGEAEDLITVPEGFTIHAYQSTERLNSFVEVDQVLAGENVEATKVLTGVPVINYLDTGRDAHFLDNMTFPFTNDSGAASNVVMDITGKINVREAGTYTLGVNSNDAARLWLNGNLLYADTERHSRRDTLIPVELSAGLHDIHLTMFERVGSGLVEFFYAPGEKTEFDDDFSLVGDITHRSFDDTIISDVQEQFAGQSSVGLVRYPFTATNLNEIESVQFRVRHDAGIVAYLNGEEIYRQGAVEGETVSTGLVKDAEALTVQVIDLPQATEALVEGDNLLAVQILNESPDDFDMLLTSQLVGMLGSPPLNFDQTTTVTARALVGSNWSATSVGTFAIDATAVDSPLRISEIHYHPAAPSAGELQAGFNDPDDFEFIELVNTGTKTIDLSNVRLTRLNTPNGSVGVDFVFEGSPITELGPGQYVVVVEDVDAFRTRYGQDVPVAGQWSGGLANDAELITLTVGGQPLHSFVYQDLWHPTTDGTGPSLERTDPTTGPLSAWGTAGAWTPSLVSGGTPGRGPNAIGDANRDGVFDMDDLNLVIAAGEFEDDIAGNSTWEEGDWDGDGDFTVEDLLLAFSSTPYAHAPASRVASIFADFRFLSSLRLDRAATEPAFDTTNVSSALADDLVRDPSIALV